MRSGTSSSVELASFTEGYFGIVDKEYLNAGDQFGLRWRGPGRIIKAISYFVFQVETFHSSTIVDIHTSQLKFYRVIIQWARCIFYQSPSETTIDSLRKKRAYFTGI